jgi:hypothetical protein
MKITTTNRRGEDRHFFASSAGSWKVNRDPVALIAAMKRERLPFNVWMVPGAVDTDYPIEMYSPQVEGAVWLGFYSDKVV